MREIPTEVCGWIFGDVPVTISGWIPGEISENIRAGISYFFFARISWISIKISRKISGEISAKNLGILTNISRGIPNATPMDVFGGISEGIFREILSRIPVAILE